MILLSYKVQKKQDFSTLEIHIFCSFKVKKNQVITPTGESKNIILNRSAVSLHNLNEIFLSATY